MLTFGNDVEGREKIMSSVRKNFGRKDQQDRFLKDVVCGCQYFPGENIDTGKSNGVFKYEQTLCDCARRNKMGDHEYEPVIPMDTNRKTPPPFVKITPEDNKPTLETNEPPQDKHHLCLPKEDIDDEDENDYEDDDDDTEEITAAELQNRLEEKYFRQSPGSSKHEYELTETRSVSPAITDDTSRESSSFQERVHSQADKIKQKFKSLKDHISKDQVASSPRIARKKDEESKTKPVKKNKFNFRKHNVKSSEKSNFHMPQAPRLSFTSLPSFSRSRSSSVKERERKRSQSSETDSQKKSFDFHFGTYPRIFSKRKKTEHKLEKPNTPKLKPKSAPSSPSSRRSPFPQRWISKFTDNKKQEETKKEEKKPEVKKKNVVQESIFISLHEDPIPQDSSSAPSPPPASTELPPSNMPVDNKNFIFISLHEERFPEKLEQMQQQNEEAEIEGEIKKAETTRKFATLLRKLETDRKLKSRRTLGGKFTDDKPEPVVITDITNDEEGEDNNSPVNLENSVEIPDEPQYSDLSPESKIYEEETEPKYKAEIFKASSKPTTPKSNRWGAALRSKQFEPKEETVKAQSRPTTPRSIHFEFDEEIIKTSSRPTTPKTIRSEVVMRKAHFEFDEEPIKSPSRPTTPKSTLKTKNLQQEIIAPSPPPEPKDTSKFVKLKEFLKETEKMIKPSSSNEPKERESKERESKEKESKKFQEFKENLLKETEKIGTLKNKIKNYFAKESEREKSDFDDKHIYEEFDNVEDTPPKETIKRVAINETFNQETNEPVPQKIPRKKLKKLDSDKESKESLSAFDDPALNDIVDFDEQQPMTKTYINDSLQEVNELPIEPKFSPNPKHFKNYEKALEKTKSSSIEIENNLYSASNTLAQLETPVPPSRPSRTRSLQRAKRNKPIYEENKENVCTKEQSQNYNTFPMARPDKPRRKFRKPRTYSNSTNSEVKSVNELEDATISQNIANSKQLSVSFLPLMSNIVGEPITNYTLRETSSMIHLNTNIPSEPPLPPKRRRSSVKDGTSKYNTLPNKKYCSKASSKTSLAESETCNGIHAEEDFEFVDDAHSTAETPPRRPIRKRSSGPSFIDDDRTSREIESLPSEKSLCDSDSKEINGYSVIKSAKKSHSQPTTSPESYTTPRRKSRRLSDFFTLPRIHTPTNYVSPPNTLPYERRLPSPSRPPRSSRGKTYREPVYTNEENINVMTDFGDEEELNFNLATVDDDIPDTNEKDEKNLQTDEVMERMKIRPLPPPPRPIRKPKDEKNDSLTCDYSQVKKNTNNTKNNLNQDTNELKIINTNADTEKLPVQPVNLERSSAVITTNRFEDSALNTPSSSGTLNVITAQRLNVSELNVAKLSINEIESSKLTTSNVDTVTMQTTDFKSERGHLVVNSVELTQPIAERLSPILREPRPILDTLESASRDVTPSSDEVPVQDIRERTRISSMIPEVGSDDESTSTATKIVKPMRRKPVRKEESPRSTVSETNTNQPTLAELMCQILQICHSSVGQAIHALLEQVIPEDREKRNEVQAAIWVITIIIAGCLMLGLQSNEKIVHHHHWDFHFPPPH